MYDEVDKFDVHHKQRNFRKLEPSPRRRNNSMYEGWQIMPLAEMQNGTSSAGDMKNTILWGWVNRHANTIISSC